MLVRAGCWMPRSSQRSTAPGLAPGHRALFILVRRSHAELPHTERRSDRKDAQQFEEAELTRGPRKSSRRRRGRPGRRAGCGVLSSRADGCRSWLACRRRSRSWRRVLSDLALTSLRRGAGPPPRWCSRWLRPGRLCPFSSEATPCGSPGKRQRLSLRIDELFADAPLRVIPCLGGLRLTSRTLRKHHQRIRIAEIARRCRRRDRRERSDHLRTIFTEHAHRVRRVVDVGHFESVLSGRQRHSGQLHRCAEGENRQPPRFRRILRLDRRRQHSRQHHRATDHCQCTHELLL